MPHSATEGVTAVRLAPSGTTLRVFPSADALGSWLAERLLVKIADARAAGRPFLLGCTTGPTPRPVFAAMAARLAAAPQDLSHLELVMMDEYLVQRDGKHAWASGDQPWSCHAFARVEIGERLNAALPANWRVRAEDAWFPDPADPEAYEARIATAGGIDFFLLASGASDGHVAFNPPGSARASRTRIIALSEETRRDNLQTFPSFGRIEAVPYHGVSVGVATITGSREVAMLALGAGKRATVDRMRRAAGYEPDWPATLVHECAAREILCDAAAAADLTLT